MSTSLRQRNRQLRDSVTPNPALIAVVPDVLRVSDKLLQAETARYLNECRPKVVVLAAGTRSILSPLRLYAL